MVRGIIQRIVVGSLTQQIRIILRPLLQMSRHRFLFARTCFFPAFVAAIRPHRSRSRRAFMFYLLAGVAALDGLGITDMATITGHKTLQMLKRYTHLRAEDLVGMLG
ncbi:MAG: hypothetical protein ACYDEV_04430 [Acidiferrobacter sp.]